MTDEEHNKESVREIRYQRGEIRVRFVKPGRQSWWSWLQGWRRLIDG